eukprot:g18671.t1
MTLPWAMARLVEMGSSLAQMGGECTTSPCFSHRQAVVVRNALPRQLVFGQPGCEVLELQSGQSRGYAWYYEHRQLSFGLDQDTLSQPLSLEHIETGTTRWATLEVPGLWKLCAAWLEGVWHCFPFGEGHPKRPTLNRTPNGARSEEPDEERSPESSRSPTTTSWSEGLCYGSTQILQEALFTQDLPLAEQLTRATERDETIDRPDRSDRTYQRAAGGEKQGQQSASHGLADPRQLRHLELQVLPENDAESKEEGLVFSSGPLLVSGLTQFSNVEANELVSWRNAVRCSRGEDMAFAELHLLLEIRRWRQSGLLREVIAEPMWQVTNESGSEILFGLPRGEPSMPEGHVILHRASCGPTWTAALGALQHDPSFPLNACFGVVDRHGTTLWTAASCSMGQTTLVEILTEEGNCFRLLVSVDVRKRGDAVNGGVLVTLFSGAYLRNELPFPVLIQLGESQRRERGTERCGSRSTAAAMQLVNSKGFGAAVVAMACLPTVLLWGLWRQSASEQVSEMERPELPVDGSRHFGETWWKAHERNQASGQRFQCDASKPPLVFLGDAGRCQTKKRSPRGRLIFLHLLPRNKPSRHGQLQSKVAAVNGAMDVELALRNASGRLEVNRCGSFFLLEPPGKTVKIWEELMPDRLHPNDQGHARLAECLMESI